MKALSAVVQGVHSVLAKLIGMDGDCGVPVLVLVLVLILILILILILVLTVLAAENNGAQCLVCLQGLRNGLAALLTQLVPRSIELRTW